MPTVILLGHSRFAQRRILPALAGLADVRIASRRAGDDFARALDEPGIVWVSLTNDAHATWARAALERGHHVIVDKPAVIELADAEALVALARDRGLVLAEALTYAWHPVIDAIREIFVEPPTHVVATFTPPIPPGGYRYDPARGGGALLDTGPYCVSLGRLLWDDDPVVITAHVVQRADVDTSYSALLRYPRGAVVGHFGFTTEYTNGVQLLGPALSVTVPRIFSTPADMVTEISVRQRDQLATHAVPAANSIARFFTAVVDAIARGDTTTFSELLLRDARALARLRQAAR